MGSDTAKIVRLVQLPTTNVRPHELFAAQHGEVRLHDLSSHIRQLKITTEAYSGDLRAGPGLSKVEELGRRRVVESKKDHLSS